LRAEGVTGLPLELSFHIVELKFTVSRRVKLEAWSGTIAGKIVYDALSISGLVLDRGGLFRVSPVRPEGASEPVAGHMAPGERYRLTAVFWGSPGVVEGAMLARAFTKGVMALDYLNVEEVSASVRSERLPEPSPPEADGEPGVASLAVVRHGPTFYRFHGAIVAYPSPWRMLASIARRLSLASGIDYRPLLRSLQPCMELAVDNTKRVRILLTHGKRVTVFRGEAKYHIACPRPHVEAITRMLDLSLLTGVGGSPGLGVGEVISVSFTKPRHELPAALEPWAWEPED
jgi:hypothetical protein